MKILSTFISFLVVLSIAILVNTIVAIADDGSLKGLSNNDIVDLYIKIALGSEFQPAGSTYEKRIFKRDQSRPVNLVPLPKPSVPIDEPFALISKVGKDIESHSGGVVFNTFDKGELVKFINRNKGKLSSDINSDWPDSILFYFGSIKELSDSLKTTSINNPNLQEILSSFLRTRSGTNFCIAATEPRSAGGMTMGMAIAWIEYRDEVEACIYEELMQSFGIGNDFPAGSPSIFNDDGVYVRPTELDWLLWRVHTDPRIKPGMNEEEARAASLNIINEIR